MDLKFTVSVKIQKPIGEVFDAVYAPDKLSRYFTTGGASAALDAGATVMWEFADHPGAFPVQVRECVENERIVLDWGSMESGRTNRVEMCFTALDDTATQLSIREAGWSESQQGLDASYMNCMGWTQMLCCLKAWLEYGINLRKGFF